MKYIISFCLICMLSINVLSGQQLLSTEDYDNAVDQLRWNTNKLVDRMNVYPNWQGDDAFWYRVSDNGKTEYVLVNSENGEKKTTDSKDILDSWLEEKKEKTKYDRRTELLSPDAQKAAYIEDWNLWVRDVKSGDKTQLTFDGIENFGYATDNAGWRKSERPILLWSPDSKKIATFQQDQRHVSDMYMVNTQVGAPKLSAWKYPLPEDDDIIRIHRVIIDVPSKDIIRLQMDPDPRRGTLCDDISCDGAFDDNYWNDDATKLVFVSTSRDHKIAQLRIADARTGEVKDIFKEEVDTQYESGQGAINWKYLPNSNEFIWYSERDNWGHLYLYDINTGELKNQITSGDFVVTRIKKLDESNRVIYFEANGKEQGRDPYFSHFYKVDFSGMNLRLLTPENGNHRISLSPNGKYFVDNYSQPDVPPVSVLRTIDGQFISTLEKADISRLLATGWKPPQPIKVKSDNGEFDLYGLMFTPNEMEEGKKYPVVNYVYPGPQGGGVGSRSFSASRRDHNALAALGFVVIVIDGSCNPNRSKAFHDAC
ncbi:MAG: S9 family peptidase, partial [Saprospiraceae bacterium]|nr:S9 family peptidase [Saprospiraceae bacterium]